MLNIKTEGIILWGTELEFENNGVMNPVVIKQGEMAHLFYGAVQKENYSSIGYCKLDDPLIITERSPHPVLTPTNQSEIKGIEDPRVSLIIALLYASNYFYCFHTAKIISKIKQKRLARKDFRKRMVIGIDTQGKGCEISLLQEH
jgi:predicted GH43/DUF377 family glycosyl hydrolase